MTRNKNIKVEVQNDFIDVMRSASVQIPNVCSARIHQITLGSENRAIEGKNTQRVKRWKKKLN